MQRRKLPIGIQTFAKMREEDYYYVDKTGFIRQLPGLDRAEIRHWYNGYN